MNSATVAETPLTRQPAAEREQDSASDHELSANDDSPPGKATRKRTHDDSETDELETESAREDLRHTRISDREKSKSPKLKHNTTGADVGSAVHDKEMENPVAMNTSEPQSPTDEEMKDRLSPKNKRPRDRDDDDIDPDEPTSNAAGEKHVNCSAVNGGSSLPTKKRYRDASQDSRATAEGKEDFVTGGTPEPQSPTDESMKVHLSPKKKRPRDRDDDEVEADVCTSNAEVEKHVNGSTLNGGSSLPLKKRHRDGSQDSHAGADEKKPAESKERSLATTFSPTLEPAAVTKHSESPKRSASPAKDTPVTSQKAFAASGFASLAATGPSPFAAVANSKPSAFAGSASALSPFGTLASQKETAPLSGFGALAAKPASGFGGASTGGFGGLAGGFGGSFGSGFSGAFGTGQKLSSFAAPAAKADIAGPTSKSGPKKEKAFGAPESSGDEGSEHDGSDGEVAGEEEDAQPVAEEKKKAKAPRAPILDGEEDEMTLCQVRAKLFVLDERWKERGVGNLKINIPRSSDDAEGGLLSFPKGKKHQSDKKSGDVKEPGNNSFLARLVMRQEHTHRVILNSVILKDQHFQEKPTNNAIGITFMAFENGKPVNMQFKMNATNAREFLREIEDVKTKL